MLPAPSPEIAHPGSVELDGVDGRAAGELALAARRTEVPQAHGAVLRARVHPSGVSLEAHAGHVARVAPSSARLRPLGNVEGRTWGLPAAASSVLSGVSRACSPASLDTALSGNTRRLLPPELYGVVVPAVASTTVGGGCAGAPARPGLAGICCCCTCACAGAAPARARAARVAVLSRGGWRRREARPPSARAGAGCSSIAGRATGARAHVRAGVRAYGCRPKRVGEGRQGGVGRSTGEAAAAAGPPPPRLRQAQVEGPCVWVCGRRGREGAPRADGARLAAGGRGKTC